MKKYIILVLIALLIGALFAVVLAAGPSKPAGESNTGLLYLYEKEEGLDPCDWDIIGDAWGKMKYNLSGEEFEFVFNGHGLVPGEDYTLVYYPDPWPPVGLICLGSGKANGGGQVNIAGSCDTGDLPIATDWNADPEKSCFDVAGAKIWLVPSDDVDCVDCGGGTWLAWNHLVEDNIYLFEEELIVFEDTSEE